MKKRQSYEIIDLRDKIREIDEQKSKDLAPKNEISKIDHRPFNRNDMQASESGRKPEEKSEGKTSRDKWRAFRWI